MSEFKKAIKYLSIILPIESDALEILFNDKNTKEAAYKECLMLNLSPNSIKIKRKEYETSVYEYIKTLHDFLNSKV
jgi:hypothetical protein